MQDPKDLLNEHRAKSYIFSVTLIIIAFGVAAAANFKSQHIGVSIVEIFLIIFFIISIFLAAKKKHLEILGNIVNYLGGFVLLYNTTQIGGVDPGPYVGIIAFLIIASFITANKLSYYIFSAVIYAGFLSLTLMGLVGLNINVNIKFQVVYIIINKIN